MEASNLEDMEDHLEVRATEVDLLEARVTEDHLEDRVTEEAAAVVAEVMAARVADHQAMASNSNLAGVMEADRQVVMEDHLEVRATGEDHLAARATEEDHLEDMEEVHRADHRTEEAPRRVTAASNRRVVMEVRLGAHRMAPRKAATKTDRNSKSSFALFDKRVNSFPHPFYTHTVNRLI